MTGQSTTEPFLPERRPLYRRVWFWIVVTVLALPVLVVGTFVVWFMTTGGWSAPEPEPMDSVGAAHLSGGSQDLYATIDLVAPQDDGAACPQLDDERMTVVLSGTLDDSNVCRVEES